MTRPVAPSIPVCAILASRSMVASSSARERGQPLPPLAGTIVRRPGGGSRHVAIRIAGSLSLEGRRTTSRPLGSSSALAPPPVRRRRDSPVPRTCRCRNCVRRWTVPRSSSAATVVRCTSPPRATCRSSASTDPRSLNDRRPWRPRHLTTESIDVGVLPCRPCEQRVCVPGDFRCLTGISAATVRAAAERLLEAG